MATKALKGILSLDNIGFIRGIKSSIDWSKRLAGELRAAGLGKGSGLLAMKGIDVGLKAAARGFRELGSIAKNALGVGLGIQLGNLTGQVIGFAKGGVAAVAKTEDWTVKMKGLGVSAKEADAEFKELQKFSFKGFDIGELEDAAVGFQHAGGAALNTAKTFEMVGNVARGTGSTFADVADIVKTSYDSMRQGSDISAQMEALREKNALTLEEVQQIETLASQAGKGGQAYTLLTDKLKRFNGQIEATKGNLSSMGEQTKAHTNSMQLALGNVLAPTIKADQEIVNKALDGFSGYVSGVLGKVDEDMDGLVSGINKVEQAGHTVANGYKEVLGTIRKIKKEATTGTGAAEPQYNGPRTPANTGGAQPQYIVDTALRDHVGETMRRLNNRGNQARHYTGKELEAYFQSQHKFNPSGKPILGAQMVPTLGARLFDTHYREEHPLGTGTMLNSGAGGGAGGGLVTGGLTTGSLNDPARRTTPLLSLASRRAIEAQSRAQENQIRIGAGQTLQPGQAVRSGDKQRLQALQRKAESDKAIAEAAMNIQKIKDAVEGMSSSLK